MIISHKIGQLKVGAHTKNYVTKGDYYNAELAGQNLLFLFFVFCFVFVLFLYLYKGNFVTNQSCISDRSFSGRYRTLW